MRQLIEVKDPQMIGSGIFKDIASGQSALWHYSENVHYAHGKVSVLRGVLALQSATDPIVALEQATVDSVPRIYFASSTAVFRLANNVVHSLHSQAGPRSWSFETWGTWLVFTNGVEVPRVSKNTTSSVVLANAPIAKMFRRFYNHLVGIFVGGEGQKVAWSSISDIETWAPLPENTAGDLFIRDLDSDIRAAEPLGTVLLLYSVNSVCVFEYVGAPNYFGTRSRMDGIGAVSEKAICVVAGKHYGLCRKGFFVTDGMQYQYTHSPQIHEWLESQINWENASSVCSWHDEALKTVYWTFDCLDGQRRGVGFNIETSAWAPFKANIRAGLSKKIFSYSVVGIDNLVAAWDRAGTPLPWTIETKRLDLGTRDFYKSVDMFQVNGEGKAGVSIEFELSNTSDEDVAGEWLSPTSLVEENWIGRDTIFLKVRMSGSGGTFNFGAIKVFGEAGGMR